MHNTLLIAGTHGVEPQSSIFLDELWTKLSDSSDLYKESLDIKEISDNWEDLFESDRFLLEAQAAKSKSQKLLISIPRLNHWGLDQFTRSNQNGVDLNRNLPASNWSKSSPQITKNSQKIANPYYSGLAANSEKENQILVKVI